MMNKKNISSDDIDRQIKDYKNFAFNKNMAKVAIGFLLMTAFQKTVTAISDFLLMPLIGYFIKETNGDWREWIIKPLSGMNLEVGHFLGVFLDFFILSIVLYIIYTFLVKKIWPDQDDVKKIEITVYLKDQDGEWKIVQNA